jgi:hypothetical protein
VTTCARVDKVQGTQDEFKAVAFYTKREEKAYPTKSEWVNSWANQVHRRRDEEHAGMGFSKTLIAYNPDAARSRLLPSDYRPHYRNTSVVEMGARGKRDQKHYITTYGNSFGKKVPPPNHHPGITAYRNRWVKRQEAK